MKNKKNILIGLISLFITIIIIIITYMIVNNSHGNGIIDSKGKEYGSGSGGSGGASGGTTSSDNPLNL